MAQTKIYPSTQAQVQAVQNTVDEINSKIVTPTYQVKTVMPSNVQQTIQADTGYTALSGVVVNPIAALMPDNLEDFIMHKNEDFFTLSLDGEIPHYACYEQLKLKEVYGNLTGTIGEYSFGYCRNLSHVETKNVTHVSSGSFFECTSLNSIDLRNSDNVGINCFFNCTALIAVDVRNVLDISIQGFSGCLSLILVDCTSCTTPPTIQANTFNNTNDGFRVAVANDTEKALFQSATNWSTRASQIYTVAEIEAIVGMTYDEYYLQIFGHARNEVQT